MVTQAMPEVIGEKKQFVSLKKIIVAHDFSVAADRALADAIALSRRFNAEIVIAHVEVPEASAFAIHSLQEREQQIRANMEIIRRRVALAGHRCKEIVRSGNVPKTIVEIGHEEAADLLLLGAYGNGSNDRKTLGSTAESLLRSMPCPVLTYGPRSTRSLFQNRETPSILVPIELPCEPHYLAFAVSVAKLFDAKLEILHVVDMYRASSMPHAFQDMQYTCESIADSLRSGEVHVSGSLLFGEPQAAIVSRCHELCNSLILIPLETRARLSSATSDNVAANVIRNADVPVMTYRID